MSVAVIKAVGRLFTSRRTGIYDIWKAVTIAVEGPEPGPGVLIGIVVISYCRVSQIVISEMSPECCKHSLRRVNITR
jgi:hypothetical protein